MVVGFPDWLMIAIGPCSLGLFLLSLFRPQWGLAVGVALLYNPYYNYWFLYTRQWEGGRIRALISVSIVVALLAAMVVRRVASGRPLRRSRTPLHPYLYAFAVFAMLAAMVGYLRENETRVLLADVFTMSEFYFYFFLAGWIIQGKKEARFLTWFILVTGAVTTLVGITLYFLWGETFGSGLPILQTKISLRRLPDFMPSLLLPFAVGNLFYARTRITRMILLICSSIFLAGLILGFFRSQWLAVIVAIVFSVWAMVKTGDIKLGRGAVVAGSLVVGLVLVSLVWHWAAGTPETIGELVYERSTFQTTDSFEARVVESRVLFREALNSPFWGKGLGGTYITSEPYHGGPLGVRPLSTAPNFYFGMAAMMGLPALFVFVGAGFVLLRAGGARFRSLPAGPDKGIILSCLACLVSETLLLAGFPILLHYPFPAYLGVMTALIFIVAPQFEEAGVRVESAPQVPEARILIASRRPTHAPMRSAAPPHTGKP